MTTNETTKQQPYVRMVIGEAMTDEAVAEFLNAWNDESQHIQAEPGFIESRILTEEGGHMILIETTWETRDACLKYHGSRAYRQLVAKTQHLLVGDFVVKLFKQTAVTRSRSRADEK